MLSEKDIDARTEKELDQAFWDSVFCALINGEKFDRCNRSEIRLHLERVAERCDTALDIRNDFKKER